MLTCAFTGHRPSKLSYLRNADHPDYCRLSDMLRATCLELYGEGFTRFLSGMALGVDMLAAEVVLKMRKEHPEVSLTCVLPCRDQANRWQEADRLRYQDILRQADEVVCLQESYSRFAMLARDRYLVQHSDCLLAVFNGSPGGTKYTVDCALRAGRRVVRIDPQTFERTEDLGQLRLPL